MRGDAVETLPFHSRIQISLNGGYVARPVQRRVEFGKSCRALGDIGSPGVPRASGGCQCGNPASSAQLEEIPAGIIREKTKEFASALGQRRVNNIREGLLRCAIGVGPPVGYNEKISDRIKRDRTKASLALSRILFDQ